MSIDKSLSEIIGVHGDIMGCKRAGLRRRFIERELQIIGILRNVKGELLKMIMKIAFLK